MAGPSQFAHPRGLAGHLAGVIMAFENRGRNRWAISQLAPAPTDRILEIGFGPGWSIAELGKYVSRGKITGADSSDAMVAQAARRNRKAVRAGRVELHHAPATRLPFPDESFDKVLTVNSLPFWDDIPQGLAEIRRVLVRDGKLVVTLQPVWVKSDLQVDQVGQELIEHLRRAGFKALRLETLPAKPAILSAIGQK